MTKNENDRDRVRFRKQHSVAYNRKVEQRKYAMAQSLAGFLSKFFDATVQKSKPLSQLEEAINESVDMVIGEPNNEDDNAVNNESKIEDNEICNPLNGKLVNEEANGEVSHGGHVEPINEIVRLAKEMHNQDPKLVNCNLRDESVNQKKDIAVNYIAGSMKKNGNDKHQVRFQKKKSGAYNRKVKKRRDAMAQSLMGSISKLFNARAQKSHSLSQVEEANNEGVDVVIGEPINKCDNVANNESKEEHSVGRNPKIDNFVTEDSNGKVGGEGHMKPINGSVHVANEEYKEIHDDDSVLVDGKFINETNNKEKESVLGLEKDADVNYDPGLWGLINDAKRLMLVQRGPIKIIKYEFPKDKNNGRRFSSKHYVYRHSNGDDYERKWLVYSNELDKVFCFCCKLFKSRPMTSKLAEDGICDWHNLPNKLREHERNCEHTSNLVKWVDLKKGLQLKATIDKEMQAKKE